MAWRLHLTNQAINQLNILDDLLGIWVRRDRVIYHTLDTGTQYGETVLIPPDTTDRQSELWLSFVTELVAPNDQFLPFVQLPQMTLHITNDGRMRLYHDNANGLFLDTDGREVTLDAGKTIEFTTVALDRFLGLIAALDENGQMHIFQQHIRVGAFDLKLNMDLDARPQIAITSGGGSIFVTDSRKLVLTDSGGRTRKSLDLAYDVRQMACSPDGKYLVTCDMEIGLIRVYDGKSLTLIYQRFAIDLMAHATQVQLIADMPPVFVAPSALTINNDGMIAFAMSGVICVTDLSHMDELPRPQTLF